MIKYAFRLVTLVVRGGVEPPTFRFSGASAASLHIAGQGLMGHLAAETMARRRLVWLDICRHWLPVWLPKISLASLTFAVVATEWLNARHRPCEGSRRCQLDADDQADRRGPGRGRRSPAR
jgi:hypothetical protein